MKKYGTHITGLILLALLALFVNEYRKKTTLNRREINFAIEDFNRIDEVIISDEERRVGLNRNNGYWLLNSRYEVREEAVEMLLQTFGRLRVSSPAPLSVRDQIMERLSDESIRIDIGMGRRTRTYFVYSGGNDSPTYMLRQGSSRPYMIEVIGFSGNAASLFVTDEGYWRTNLLFNYRLDEIAEVTVYHGEDEDDSFILRQSADRDFSLYSYPGDEGLEGINDSLAIRYLANFFYTPYERFANRNETMLMDSLFQARPDHMVRVTHRDGTDTEVFFHKIITENENGSNHSGFDLFRLYALINDRSEMVVVPYHSVDLILRSASYFYSKQR